MRFTYLSLALAAATLAPRPASANSCNAFMPWVSTAELPLGCPLVVHADQTIVPPGTTPEVARRGAPNVPLTATGTHTVETYPVTYVTPDENCDELYETRQAAHDSWSLDVAGAAVGDELAITINGHGPVFVQIIAAGPCPAPTAPMLYCQAPIQDFSDCEEEEKAADAGGCHAAGPAALLVGLVLVPLVLRPRTRSRRLAATRLAR